MSRRNWTRAATVGTALSLTLLLVNCNGDKKDGTTIRIGAVLPMTGSAARWGVPVRDAALLAVDEVNSKGGIKGKKIEFEVEDDKCEQAVGVSAAQKILGLGKPIAFLGSVCSSVTLAIAPIADSNRVVLISPASTSPLITDAGEYVFRVIPTDALRGKVFAEYIYSLGHRNVSLLYIDNEGGLGSQKAFAKSFQTLGGNILSVDAYPQDTQDLKAQLAQIKQRKPEAVIIVSYLDDTAIVLREAQELGVTLPLFFQTEALDDPGVIKKAGNAAEGVTYILPAKPDGPSVEAFVTKYKQRYGRAPELFAAEGYDTVMLITRILESATEVSSDALKAGLYKTQNYSGASGLITFDHDGDVVKPMAIRKISKGVSVVVAKN